MKQISGAQLGILAGASSLYMHKYEEVSAPHECTTYAIEITKPACATHIRLEGDNTLALVASAEQSFLQMRLDGELPDGDYQATTPCWRDEPEDETHHKYFMKLELIRVSKDPLSEEDVMELMADADNVMERLGVSTKAVKTDEAEHSWDLVCSLTGIELGSYGIRQHPEIGYWVYATGLAEPRFSHCRQLQQEAGK